MKDGVDPNFKPATDMKGWLFPSKRMQRDVQNDAIRAVNAELDSYRVAVWHLRNEERMRALPDKLDKLWRNGEPIEGGTPIESVADRRRAVLRYWASRADTIEGHAIRQVVQNWMEVVIASSDTPFTNRELDDAANMHPQGAHPFDR